MVLQRGAEEVHAVRWTLTLDERIVADAVTRHGLKAGPTGSTSIEITEQIIHNAGLALRVIFLFAHHAASCHFFEVPLALE